LRYAPGGSVVLSVRRGREGHARFEVSDDGPGVPPEFRERIFDMYAKIERDERGRHRDSRGLGLRFCRVAVEAQRGRIWVEDNEPTGARFCIELPAA
jgi:signal transduction histidine kinase